jgi:hypothetical protein
MRIYTINWTEPVTTYTIFLTDSKLISPKSGLCDNALAFNGDHDALVSDLDYQHQFLFG